MFTTEDLKCGTEVLPPIAPLACALMSDVRGCYCDYCFKSVEDCGKSVSACIARLILCETTLCRPLRRCSRCRFAYYCSKACQVMSCFQCSYWHKTPTHTHTTHTHTHTHPHTHTHTHTHAKCNLQESDWRSHKHECRVTISKAWLSVMMRLVLRCMHLQVIRRIEGLRTRVSFMLPEMRLECRVL